nr:copia protein [Tanacetum cinerariifolium]
MGYIKLLELGLQVKQKDDGIFISQDKYVAEILRKFGLIDGKSASTPIDTKKPLLKDPDGEDVDVHIYSDYVGASHDRKSTTGGCQFLGCRLISWQCKKQNIVATSSIKAKYVAVASCCAQVLWIQNQLLDYGPKLVMLVLIEAQDHISNESPLLGVNTPRCDEDRLTFMNGFLSTKLMRMMELELLSQIVDFLNAQVIHYALMVNPTNYVSCVKHFWATALVKRVNDVVKLQALIDRKKVVISEDIIRQDLRLDDADGVECLPTE